MTKHHEVTSASVSEETKQAEEALREKWNWVEQSVWTIPMLMALETGVKGGKWFSLMDKVYRKGNLTSAFYACWRNGGSAGVDKQTVEQFDQGIVEEIDKLEKELKTGSYRPLPIRRAWIEKPGTTEKRPLGIPTVRDRTVQGGLRNVMEPIFEKVFAQHSYGFRPERGCKQALRRVDELLGKGHSYVVDVDFKSYFDTIPHNRLMEKVKELIADGRVLELIEKYLKAGVLEEMKEWKPTTIGTPQGAVISPLLANLYLNDLDHEMEKAGYQMTRYADDFVVQCQTREEAEAALEKIKRWSEENQLIIHPEKTRIVDARERGGFDFLGYHFERGMKWPRKKSLTKFKDKIRERTKRTNGNSMEAIIARLNPMMRGWYGYFKHSIPNELEKLDGWLRRRLRAILIKRKGKKGFGKGRSNIKWPNQYFDNLKLFRLSGGGQTNHQFA
jgi:RNA-directed DNA polymerase